MKYLEAYQAERNIHHGRYILRSSSRILHITHESRQHDCVSFNVFCSRCATHARLNMINAHPTPYTYLEYSSIKVSTIITLGVRRGASILRLQEKGIVVILRKRNYRSAKFQCLVTQWNFSPRKSTLKKFWIWIIKFHKRSEIYLSEFGIDILSE